MNRAHRIDYAPLTGFWTLSVMNGAQLAAMYVFLGYGLEIYVFETADVNRPQFGCCARMAKWLDSAHRAKVVLRRFRVPLIQRQLVGRSQKHEITCGHAMKQPAAPTTNRAIADPDMVEIRLDLEFDAATVTTTPVCLFHDVSHLS